MMALGRLLAFVVGVAGSIPAGVFFRFIHFFFLSIFARTIWTCSWSV